MALMAHAPDKHQTLTKQIAGKDVIYDSILIIDAVIQSKATSFTGTHLSLRPVLVSAALPARRPSAEKSQR